ncbi:MAG: sigma-70 family RNA polymerase sigma factor [Archangium sp.]
MRVAMQGSEPDDEQLVLRARHGDAQAFRLLVQRYQPGAVAFGIRYLGDPARARDAAQDAFVDLYFALARYQPRGRFAAYWHRLLVNRCRMGARADRSRDKLHDDVATLRVVHAPSPEDAFVAREDQLALQAGMARLSEKLRVVVALRFGAGLPLQEIADTLELPLGTVKSRVFAGLAELRAAVKETP